MEEQVISNETEKVEETQQEPVAVVEPQVEPVTVVENAVEQVKVCPKCNATVSQNQSFCSNCGTALECIEAVVIKPVCSKCGAEISAETKFCQHCGTEVAVVNTAPVQKKKSKKLFFILGGIALILITAIVATMCYVFRKIPVESVVLSETSIKLVEDETRSVVCTVLPVDATDKTVLWISSDENVATVDSEGVITAVKSGECTIKAVSGERSATIEVTVKKKGPNFNAIYNEFCNSIWAEVGSDGSYLFVDSNPYNYDDGDYRYTFTVSSAIEKINRKMGLPDSLYKDMLQTTWSMGKQKETYPEQCVEVTWTYHPDKGIEVNYKLIEN